MEFRFKIEVKGEVEVMTAAVPEAKMAKQEDLTSEEEEEEEEEQTTKGQFPSDSEAGGAKVKGTLHRLASLSQHLKKSHSLKRSLALKNPLGGSSGGVSTCSSSKVKSEQPKKRAKQYNNVHHNVRNFFNRVVAQVNSTGARVRGRKFDLSEDRLQEWRRRFEDQGKVPGVVGIRNHGNTCFINAILQCLSYTDILAEYFVLDQYKSDLRRKRRITTTLTSSFSKRPNGAGKGEVTEQLALLLKSLWSLQYDPEISIRFKSLVDKHASQYKGGSQHDAQEFLLWLLDQVHEDLNTATRRRYKKANSAQNQQGNTVTDEQLAAESLANYLRCNNSFVMDVFQAQFRSSLTCPTCERQSNTFDPFLCVSLPIPQKQLMPVFVTVLYIDQTPRQVKLGLTIGVDETVLELKRRLSKDTGIEQDLLLLTEIGPLGFIRTLKDHSQVTVIKDLKEPLYCIEMPKYRQTSEDDGAFVLLTWVNVLKEGPIEKRFGSPYTIQVSRETLYSDLQKLLMKEMSPILHDDILIGSQKVPLFKIRIVDEFSESKNYLDSNVDLPMYVESVEQTLNLCNIEPGSGPPHVKLILEWDMPAKTQVINDDSDVIEEHISVKEVEKMPDNPEAMSVTLQECFSLYTSAEKLGQGDAWFCPACNRKQEVVKRMGLWSVPDVLVIHLKRFRQSSSATNKLSTMVDFPLESFDMSLNVMKSSNKPQQEVSSNMVGGQMKDDNTNGLKMWTTLSPWKHPKRFPNQNRRDDEENYMYDLYAVCNHHGSDLQGGHYTAFCRNPTDGQWYNFDDMHTKAISEPDVITKDAYILFYQRHSVGSSSSSSSSSSGSNQEHWVFRMPDFNYKKGGATIPKSKSKEKVESKEENKSSSSTSPFKRNDAKYATMPAKSSTTPKELADKDNCEPDHQSDIEIGCDDEDKEDDEEVKTSKTKQDANDEEEDDVTRPLDKNDVD